MIPKDDKFAPQWKKVTPLFTSGKKTKDDSLSPLTCSSAICQGNKEETTKTNEVEPYNKAHQSLCISNKFVKDNLAMAFCTTNECLGIPMNLTSLGPKLDHSQCDRHKLQV